MPKFTCRYEALATSNMATSAGNNAQRSYYDQSRADALRNTRLEYLQRYGKLPSLRG